MYRSIYLGALKYKHANTRTYVPTTTTIKQWPVYSHKLFIIYIQYNTHTPIHIRTNPCKFLGVVLYMMYRETSLGSI